MKLQLISFKICPFAQRSVITMLYKGIALDTVYIDLQAPPDWFKEVSPFGKVPILIVDERAHIIFESAVICEFLDESTPGSLLPADPLLKAVNRSWIEFGSMVLSDFSAMIHSKEEDAYEKKYQDLQSRLQWLENMLGDGPYFNDNDISLVDFAFAPLFMRTELLNMGASLYPPDRFARVSKWSQQLLSLPAVQASVVDDFPTLFSRHIIKQGPAAARILGL